MDPVLSVGPGRASSAVIYRRILRRLVPFLLLCFLAAYLDRVNIGFAKLQMQADLGFSDYAYGLGAGIFFIGYAAFEVPSNLILHRTGARRWIARIMLSWGLVSLLFAFVRHAWQFHLLRLLLGLAEAGFAPGALFYLTTWFPSAWRARANALMLIAIPLSGALGAPLSGALMQGMDKVAGVAGWRWMFAFEALPAILAGLLVLRLLPDRPHEVGWLTPDEKATVAADLAREAARRNEAAGRRTLLADRRVWLLAAIYFCVVMGQYAISFWLPSIVRQAGVASPLRNGLLSALPFLCATLAMLALGTSADRNDERRWHLALPMALGALSLAAAPSLASDLPLSILCLSLAAAGLLAATPMFWSLPPAFLGGVQAAAGIAGINALGNVAGFASPFLIGAVVHATAKMGDGLYLIAAIVLLGAGLVCLVPRGGAR